jgi:hypothetical protein
MSREPGTPPQFDRLLHDLKRAKEAWDNGDYKRGEAILKVVGSIALDESKERGEYDPVPEAV